jgi:glycopeptide antibiotics resistance protein
LIVFIAAIRALLIAFTATVAIIMLMAAVITKYPKIHVLMFVFYLSGIFYITLFSRVASEEGQGVNLLPFRFVYWIIQYAKGPTYQGVFRPILGVYMNILMFIPFGFLAKVWKPTMAPWKIILAGFGFTLIIESAQLVFHLGMFETDDLITNTVGTWVGTVIYRKQMERI